jgi:hypothetical protein
MRLWPGNVVKVRLNQAAQDSPADPENNVCYDALEDEKQHIEIAERNESGNLVRQAGTKYDLLSAWETQPIEESHPNRRGGLQVQCR